MKKLLPYVLVFAMFASLYLITAPGRMWNTDGWTRYLVGAGLVDYGWPLLPPDKLPGSYWIVYGPDGNAYAYYGLGQSLAFAPLYAFGKAIGAVVGSPLADWPSLIASFLNSIVASLLALAVYGLARQIGYNQRVSLGTAALGGLGTIAWAHSRDNYDHLLEALCLAASLAVLMTAFNKKSSLLFLLSGLVFAYGIMTRVSILFAAPGIGLLLLLGPGKPRIERSHLRNALSFVAGAAPGLLINVAYGYLRFGRLFSTGYETKAPYWFGTPVWLGAVTFLVSPGRGLLWYVPLTLALPFLAMVFYRRVPGLALSMSIIGLSYLLVYSQFSGLGMWGWGPFYLLPLMPLIAIVWAEALDRWPSFSRLTQGILLVLVVLSVSIQALSASTAWITTYIRATIARAEFTLQIDWQPEWSLLLNQPRNIVHSIEQMGRRSPLEFITTAASHEYQLRHDVGLNTLDWWWVLAMYRGVRLAWLAPLALLTVLGVSVWGFIRLDERGQLLNETEK